MIRREVLYFKKVGPDNTEACLELLEKAKQEGYQHFVVASTTGETGAKAARLLCGPDLNLVVVGHCVGFRGPNVDEFLPEHEREIVNRGGKVFKGTILTHSLETSIAEMFKGSAPTLLIANTLRRSGPRYQGLL